MAAHRRRPGGDRGAAAMALLIVGLVTMAIMVVVVLKVMDKQEDENRDALKEVRGITTTTTLPGGATAPTTGDNIIDASQGVACTAEKQAVEQAEVTGSELEGRPLDTQELLALGYLRELPEHYEVVVQPDGTTLVRTKVPAVCP